MRIAMLAPISWRTPPRHYGPWELVTSLLTEALVARGVDVTLFATADPITAGTLAGVCPAPYSEDPTIDAKVWETAPRRACVRARRRVRSHPQPGRLRAARLFALRRRLRSSPRSTASRPNASCRSTSATRTASPTSRSARPIATRPALRRHDPPWRRARRISIRSGRQRKSAVLRPHPSRQGRRRSHRGRASCRPAAGDGGHRSGSALLRAAGGAFGRRNAGHLRRTGRRRCPRADARFRPRAAPPHPVRRTIWSLGHRSDGLRHPCHCPQPRLDARADRSWRDRLSRRQRRRGGGAIGQSTRSIARPAAQRSPPGSPSITWPINIWNCTELLLAEIGRGRLLRIGNSANGMDRLLPAGWFPRKQTSIRPSHVSAKAPNAHGHHSLTASASRRATSAAQ